MQISLSSGGYDIVSSGQVFLFGEEKDLKLDIHAENDFDFSVVFNFSKDTSDEHRIDVEIVEKTIYLSCINFQDNGTGITIPASIATIDGKELYLLCWSYLEGKDEKKARNVKYTLFLEK